MSRAERWRAALFLGACAALIVAALAFAASAQQATPPSAASPGRPRPAGLRLPAVARRAEARAERLSAGLRRSARRFLAAFFRYEVGEGGRALDAALRARAIPAFARRLLAAPPRPPSPGGFPPPARLRRLRVSFVSAGGERALVTGSALRGGLAEQFSFLFERRRSLWLASGPGQ
jgi:hypothetical protein